MPYINPKIALVLGNGPSTKAVDFAALARSGFATVGMNAAYRYWRRINFRPTHYICMDSVVQQSHAEEIAQLIREGRIQKFFLRDELKESYPEFIGHSRILWFSEARERDNVFKTNYVTTGSWAIRWMLFEGRSTIATIGIDANYVEVIKESKKVNDSPDDIQLEITETPSSNPNYFFDDYQRAGDKYNIPNSPEYIKEKGSLVHVDSLKKVKEYLAKNKREDLIVDLSPLSAHGIFVKKDASQFFGETSLSILTSFHLKIADDVLIDNVKMAILNARTTGVRDVNILLEGSLAALYERIGSTLAGDLRHLQSTKRINIQTLSSRPSYFDTLVCAGKLGQNYIAVANSDIFFPEQTVGRILASNLVPNHTCFALTRWNVTENGMFIQGLTPSPPWAEEHPSDLRSHQRNYFSYDAYVFKGPIAAIPETKNVMLGTLGCDTALVAILKMAGFVVTNPCLALRIAHFDVKPRSYQSPAAIEDLRKNISGVLLAWNNRVAPGVKGLPGADLLIERHHLWLGHTKAMGFAHGLHRALGATPWSDVGTPTGFAFRPILLERSAIERKTLDLKSLIAELDREAIFIKWEISGFDKNDIVDVLLFDPNYADEATALKHYQWQSLLRRAESVSGHADTYDSIIGEIEKILSRAPNPRAGANITPMSDEEANTIAAGVVGLLKSNLALEKSTETPALGSYGPAIIMIDPDALDSSGHYLAYDRRFAAAASNQNAKVSLLLNRKIDRALLSRDLTAFSLLDAHSWDVARSAPDAPIARQFVDSIRETVSTYAGDDVVLYMYCGSVEHALLVQEALRESPKVRAVIHLFWLSVDRYRSAEYLSKWKSFLSEAGRHERLQLTVATEHLQALLAAQTGVRFDVAPHPSTTFDDGVDILPFVASGGEKSLRTKVLFPGGMRSEKGFETSLEVVGRLARMDNSRFDCVVAARSRPDTPRTMLEALSEVRGQIARLEDRSLTEAEFIEFLASGDVVVLPYKAVAFAERPSGMLIDAITLIKPVVVLEGTWLANQIDGRGWGEVARDDPASIASAIAKIASNYASYQRKIAAGRDEYLSANSWKSLIHSIVSGPDAMSAELKHNFVCTVDCARSATVSVDETEVVAHMMADQRGRGNLMLDVGAHFGFSAAYFDKLGWTIRCFEPDPMNREKLVAKLGKSSNVTIDPRAVSDRPATGVSFFQSEESTGISALHAFRDTHRESGKVDVTTIDEVSRARAIGHVDFLKIDVEGFDFSVLKGVPWDRLRPEVIECEFEDYKTVPLGHTYKEVAQYLVDRGYAVYLSEWHPIIRYGIRHDWRRLVSYPGPELPSDAWGNILAFRRDPGLARLAQAFEEVIAQSKPGFKLPLAPVQDTGAASSAPSTASPAAQAVAAAPPPAVKSPIAPVTAVANENRQPPSSLAAAPQPKPAPAPSPAAMVVAAAPPPAPPAVKSPVAPITAAANESRRPPSSLAAVPQAKLAPAAFGHAARAADTQRPFYADFGEWLMPRSPRLFRFLQRMRRGMTERDGIRARAPTLYRFGQILGWCLKAAWRRKLLTLLLILVCAALVGLPLVHPPSAPWRPELWTLAALVFCGAAMAAILREAFQRLILAQDKALASAVRETRRAADRRVADAEAKFTARQAELERRASAIKAETDQLRRSAQSEGTRLERLLDGRVANAEAKFTARQGELEKRASAIKAETDQLRRSAQSEGVRLEKLLDGHVATLAAGTDQVGRQSQADVARLAAELDQHASALRSDVERAIAATGATLAGVDERLAAIVDRARATDQEMRAAIAEVWQASATGDDDIRATVAAAQEATWAAAEQSALALAEVRQSGVAAETALRVAIDTSNHTTLAEIGRLDRSLAATVEHMRAGDDDVRAAVAAAQEATRAAAEQSALSLAEVRQSGAAAEAALRVAIDTSNHTTLAEIGRLDSSLAATVEHVRAGDDDVRAAVAATHEATRATTDQLKAALDRSETTATDRLIRLENSLVDAADLLRSEIVAVRQGIDQRMHIEIDERSERFVASLTAAIAELRGEIDDRLGEKLRRATADVAKAGDDTLKAELLQAVDAVKSNAARDRQEAQAADSAIRSEIAAATHSSSANDQLFARLIARVEPSAARTIEENLVSTASFDAAFPDITSGVRKPVYKFPNQLSFSPFRESGGKRVIVNTVPKSGTYLFARLLDQLGGVNAGIHLSSGNLQDFRDEPLENVIAQSSAYNTPLVFARSAKLIADGQFAVAHLDYSLESSMILKDFVHFFCVRDIRDVLVSFMRFSLDPRRKDVPNRGEWSKFQGAELFARFLEGPGRNYLKNRIRPITTWIDSPDVVVLRFEDITGKQGETAQSECLARVCKAASLPEPVNAKVFLDEHVLNKETRTYTGKLSDYRDYWSAEAEETYRQAGGEAINAKLGYK